MKGKSSFNVVHEHLTSTTRNTSHICDTLKLLWPDNRPKAQHPYQAQVTYSQ